MKVVYEPVLNSDWRCCGTNSCTFCRLFTTFAAKLTQIDEKYLFCGIEIGFYGIKRLVVRGTLSYNININN